MIDVNVSLSRWPCRTLPHDELPKLVEKLRAVGVTQAWAGSFDALLHKDIGGVNTRLAKACRRVPQELLRPFGTVNPMLPDWREDLRRCHEVQRMRGIRLYPNYHGYQLDHPLFAELLTLAAQRGLLVQLAVRMEDPRMQHPLMRVPDVDTKPLANLVSDCPQLQLVLLNSLQVVRGDALKSLVATGRVYFEIATLEGVAGIARVLEQIPINRLLFGSHFPLFILESAVLKLRESELTAAQVKAITRANAQRLLVTVHGRS
jgi:predicted TIM-barrel fold metal-dependent hydrolase